MKLTIVETNETFDSIDAVAIRLNVTKRWVSVALCNDTKIKGFTVIKEEGREDTNWSERFSESWNEACDLVKKSKRDLSKIKIVCGNPSSIYCI